MHNKTYSWRTASVIQETEDAVTVIFDTNGSNFTYKPGQFVNVRHIINEEAVSRSYSLSSSPDEDERPAITIKKVEGGKMSNYIFQHAEIINQWEIEGPNGNFFADVMPVNENPVVLIGGGSGITPLYSILKSFLKHSNAPVFLIDCNRTWDEVVFSRGITYMEQLYPERLQVQHFLSRETERTEFPGLNIRLEKLSKLVLKKTLKKLLSDQLQEASYFLCGPNGLIDLSMEVLDQLEIPSHQLHTEYFLPPSEQQTPVELPQTSKEVLLHYYDRTNLLEVHPGKTILDAALEERIPLRYSCRNGTCGNCVARHIKGQLHMAKNYALTAEDLQQNLVLLCQSHPLDDEVIISVGDV